ncbi:MAG: immunoglobulin domain-containing protein [Verrucomicrobiota bacterium]|jgi:hypothetical protein
MEPLLKGFIRPGRILPLIAVLLAISGRPAMAQVNSVYNYLTLKSALRQTSYITNFVTNTPITVGATLAINSNSVPQTSVTIDGGTNTVVLDGNAAVRLFQVYPGFTLTLRNLQLLNGNALLYGGAVLNQGTLIISNCIVSGNAATNITGTNGVDGNSGQNNGESGESGGSAYGGAIYSTGSLCIYCSLFGTNSALAGNGGAGGSGATGVIFGGNAGDGGSGGTACGGAIYGSGPTNIIFATEFIDNKCAAGSGAAGGGAGSGPFPGDGGSGGGGGSAEGGAVYVSGPLSLINAGFYLNSTAAGSSGPAKVNSDGSGSDGISGGIAAGGGLYIASGANRADVENAVFYNNSCTGGAGGSASGQGTTGGAGGTAVGGGLASAAVLATVRNCTLATNTLSAGGFGTGARSSGVVGGTNGWDIGRSAGVMWLTGSVLSGGSNQAPNYMPNAYKITDAGYNFSSDLSLLPTNSTSQFDDTNLAQVFTSTALDPDSGDFIGPTNATSGVTIGMVVLSLEYVGSLETNVPGVPGISFPATDELLYPRRTPTTAGAYELNPLAEPLPTGVSVDITDPPNSQLVTNGQTNVQFTVGASISDTTFPLGYQWQLNGTNLVDGKNVSGSTSNVLTINKVVGTNIGSYKVLVSPSTLIAVATSSIVSLAIYSNPAVAITSPTTGSRTTNSLIEGTALGTPSVANVTCWITNLETGAVTTNRAVLASRRSATTTWSLSNALSPGTNIVVAQTLDALSHASPHESVKLFFIVPSRLTLATNGNGKITGSVSVAGNTPPANGALLNIGEDYTVTATPLAGGAFGNWTGSITSPDDTLSFIMESNLVLQANFTPGPPVITLPAANARTTNSIVAGTTSGNTQLTNILLRVTNLFTGLTLITNIVPTPSNWTLNIPLSPGTNILAVQSVGNSNAASPTVSRQFFFVQTAKFTLATNGNGRITGGASVAGNTPPANGAMLNVGEGYTLTATPLAGGAFGDWTGTIAPTARNPLTFIMASNTLLQANFVPGPPTITLPAANARTTNTMVAGTTSGNTQLTNILLWVTNLNTGITLATNTVPTPTNWALHVALSPGTNIVVAQSVGNSNAASPAVSRAFFFIQTALFTLSSNGNGAGTVTGSASVAGNVPPTNGARLNIGEGYTLTATAGKDSWFTNWTSSTGFISNSPTLHFIMESGLAIQAHFVTNLFLGAAGPFNGLFYMETNAITGQTAGMLSGLSVKSSGVYSGKLLLGSATYSLGGTFNTSGSATNPVARLAAAGGLVTVEMYLQWTNGVLNGTVSGTNAGGWHSTLYAEAAGASSNSAEYTALFLSTNAVGAGPPGYGYVLMTNHLGNLTLSYTLADGTAFSQSTPLGEYGEVPFYGTNSGLLLGWISLSNGTPQAVTPVTWIKPAAKTGLFTNGFTNLLFVEGSGWTNRAMSLNGQTLIISNAAVDSTYIISTTNSTVVKEAGSPSTNILTGTFSAKTGLLQLTFGTGVGKATLTGSCAILQNATNGGGGNFATKTNAGLILLQP